MSQPHFFEAAGIRGIEGQAQWQRFRVEVDAKIVGSRNHPASRLLTITTTQFRSFIGQGAYLRSGSHNPGRITATVDDFGAPQSNSIDFVDWYAQILCNFVHRFLTSSSRPSIELDYTASWIYIDGGARKRCFLVCGALFLFKTFLLILHDLEKAWVELVAFLINTFGKRLTVPICVFEKSEVLVGSCPIGIGTSFWYTHDGPSLQTKFDDTSLPRVPYTHKLQSSLLSQFNEMAQTTLLTVVHTHHVHIHVVLSHAPRAVVW